MPRDRHQTGWVHVIGKRPVWRGEYYVYEKGPDGRERRRHRAAVLGPVGSMTKRSAERALLKIIANAAAPVSDACTFGWFYKERYLPMRQGRLKESSLYHLGRFFDRYLLPEFGGQPLADLRRFEMQKYLDGLAQSFGASVIHKARVYLSALLEEALYQGFVERNEAKLLTPQRVERQYKRFLKSSECRALLQSVLGRDNLILRLLIFCGLRPGELFALRWDDLESRLLRIDERIYMGQLDTPKTAAGASYVMLPVDLARDLLHWKSVSAAGDRDWIFPSETGTPIRPGNWAARNLEPAAAKAGLGHVNFQVLRRTFATVIQKHGTIKDAQAQLRHASPDLTLRTYMQAIPESVQEAVDSLERELTKPTGGDTIQ